MAAAREPRFSAAGQGDGLRPDSAPIAVRDAPAPTAIPAPSVRSARPRAATPGLRKR